MSALLHPPAFPLPAAAGPSGPGADAHARPPIAPPRTPADAPLSAAQTAFVRSWAEGLDLQAAWRRYLAPEGPADARQVRAELQRLLERLRDVARAQGRPDLAVLLRRDPEAMADPAGDAPGLEAFAAAQPPDFYSEAELQALYAEIHGRRASRSSARRRERLRERLVAAVQILDRGAAARPQPSDSPQRWFDAGLAARLLAAGLHTLAALQDWIARRGLHWHRPLHRIGPVAATRVVAWLHAHRDSLGALPAEAGWTRQGPRSGSADADRVRHATPRTDPAPASQAQWIRETSTAAEDGLVATAAGHPDATQVRLWLAEHRPGSHTWRAYRREAERWLLWAQAQGEVRLQALGAEAAERYLAFLAAPPLAWTAARGTPRWSAHWRPLEGPLGPRSLQATQDILASLCAWMQRQGLRSDNPWAERRTLVPHPQPAGIPVTHAAHCTDGPDTAGEVPAEQAGMVDRVAATGPARALRRPAHPATASLSATSPATTWLADWDWVRAWVAQLPATPRMQRLGALLHGLVRSGQRLTGLARADTARIGHLDRPQQALGAARLRELVRAALQTCADWVRPRNPDAAARLAEADARWLQRIHLHLSLAQGLPRSRIQQTLGWRSWPRGRRRRGLALG